MCVGIKRLSVSALKERRSPRPWNPALATRRRPPRLTATTTAASLASRPSRGALDRRRSSRTGADAAKKHGGASTHLPHVLQRLLVDTTLLKVDLRGLAHLLDDTVEDHALFIWYKPKPSHKTQRESGEGRGKADKGWGPCTGGWTAEAGLLDKHSPPADSTWCSAPCDGDVGESRQRRPDRTQDVRDARGRRAAACRKVKVGWSRGCDNSGTTPASLLPEPSSP